MSIAVWMAAKAFTCAIMFAHANDCCIADYRDVCVATELLCSSLEQYQVGRDK